MKKILALISPLFLLMAGCGGGTQPVATSETKSSESQETSIASSEASSEITTEETSELTSSEEEFSSSEEVISSSEIETSLPEIKDKIKVDPIENIDDDFIFGVDFSSVISLEQGGVKFYDFYGRERDIFEVVAASGVNYVRVRVWNDPYDADGHGYGGGNCDINKALEIGKRVTKYGMKLLVDFHYSDFWADPKKQKAPKAWADYDIDTKADALYTYTYDSLTLLKNNGVDVGMVQVGNETNNGLMCGETTWANTVALMKEGSRAIRATYPDALVAVHFTNPEKAGRLTGYAKNLQDLGLDYDVFGTSYYPYWHGTLSNLSSVLTSVATGYNKKVMVMETSYLNTTVDTDYHSNTIQASNVDKSVYPYSDYAVSEQGQSDFLHDLCDTLVNSTTNCIGMAYWEGAWISAGGNSWNANHTLWEQYGSGWASSYSVEYDPDDAGKWYGGSAVDNEAFFYKGGKPRMSLRTFNKLKGIGVITDDSSEESVESSSSQDNTNYLLNPGFEDAADTSWTLTKINESQDTLVITPYDYAKEGSNALNYWDGAAENLVEFRIEQTLNNLEAGKYNYTIDIMGGDAGEYEAYNYVKINDEVVSTGAGEITGWNSWYTMSISDIECQTGDEIIFGVYVKCSGANAWGYLDNAFLTRA
ncbi:MAG: glycosyl hydrolase 53 family protein [Bacilli bacterium]|nr:glycosyl hydrolase 53 family protein [Bacilli bacterium]